MAVLYLSPDRAAAPGPTNLVTIVTLLNFVVVVVVVVVTYTGKRSNWQLFTHDVPQDTLIGHLDGCTGSGAHKFAMRYQAASEVLEGQHIRESSRFFCGKDLLMHTDTSPFSAVLRSLLSPSALPYDVTR
ncbi:hypothetical protein F4861DRAFT_542625 [Xylaria intraflava]|nr:hypothetical protein F4861DRAFT_542625 [Xylaria intraflava]